MEVHKEKGYVAFSDQNGELKVVYTSPVALLANNKKTTIPIDWDGPSTSIIVSLPDLSYPVIIAFGVSSQLPYNDKGIYA